MNIPLTHCYLAPFGVFAAISYLLYVVVRVVIFYKTFSWYEIRPSTVARLEYDKRTDLPEGDLKRMPECLKYRSVDALFEYEIDRKKYVTSCLSVWDYVGIWNVSGFWVGKFEEGDEVPIYVSRYNSERAVLSKRITGSGLFETVVVALACAGLSVFLISCLDELAPKEMVLTALLGLVAGVVAILFSARASSRKIWSARTEG